MMIKSSRKYLGPPHPSAAILAEDLKDSRTGVRRSQEEWIAEIVSKFLEGGDEEAFFSPELVEINPRVKF